MGVHYKLCMMGMPLSGPLLIYGDNKLQVTNLSRPKSTLKKKSHSICYHAIHESVAMGESLITHCKTNDNLSNPLTKLTFGAKCRRLIANILYDIFDDHPQQKPGQNRPNDPTRWTDLEGTEEIWPCGGSISHRLESISGTQERFLVYDVRQNTPYVDSSIEGARACVRHM
jgi:hypothetical protein